MIVPSTANTRMEIDARWTFAIEGGVGALHDQWMGDGD